MPEAIGVVGGGTMGVGIVYVFAAAGYDVWLAELDDGRWANARATLSQAAAQGVSRGKMTPDTARKIAETTRRVKSAHELPTGLALAIETVPERLAVKREVLQALDSRHPGIIATNTSALSINELSRNVGDPSTFLGMHFFNPVWSLPMIELVRADATDEATLARARCFAQSVGKTTITVLDAPGFATSRLDLIASLEAMRMLQEGVASAEDIDRAMVVAYRHPVGPLRLSDIVGLDVRLDIARNLASTLGERYAPPRLLEDMVARGDLGRKTGRGFFEWPSAANGKA